MWDTEHLKEAALCIPPVQNLGVAGAAMGTRGRSRTSPGNKPFFSFPLSVQEAENAALPKAGFSLWCCPLEPACPDTGPDREPCFLWGCHKGYV